MPLNFIYSVVKEYSYPLIFLLTTLYFLFLYFGVGSLFLFLCKKLEQRNLLHKIHTDKQPSKTNVEIKHSLVSIFIFGWSGVAMVAMIRQGWVHLLPDTVGYIALGLLILVLWNELHFFLVHRLMHIPFLYRHVHKIHHQSTIPTVYSVYSFHWVEAALLSTVPLCIAPFIPFAALAILLFPLASVLLNYAGHCNYRFGNGKGASWKRFGTRHAAHHYRHTHEYGFALNWFDKIFSYFRNH